MTRRAVAALLAVMLLGGAGAVLLTQVVDRDGGTAVESSGGSSDTGAAPGSTEPSTTTSTTSASSASAGSFPDAISRQGDGECSVPRTDPDHPAIEATGELTDGVEISEATVSDRAAGEIVFTAKVSHAPVVRASSGTKWALIELGGVRRVATENVTVESTRARAEPANLCDDSAWAFAYAFDGQVTGLELVTHDETTVEILVRLS
jgi:hypothetical protein